MREATYSGVPRPPGGRVVHEEELVETGRRRQATAASTGPIALRCHSEPEGFSPRPIRRNLEAWPRAALIIDSVPVPGGEGLWFGIWCLDPGMEDGDYILARDLLSGTPPKEGSRRDPPVRC